MRAAKITLLIIGSLLLVLFLIYGYYGGFYPVRAEIQQKGGEVLVYQKMTGDYAQSPDVSDKVYNKLLREYNITTTRGFGIYYDHPKTTDKDSLRADVGCILESDFEKVEHLRADFEVKEYPNDNYLVADFPFKGMPSVIFGIMKVYPALNTYVEENGYDPNTPVMEIWDLSNNKIEYRKELVKIQN
ncbi:GyrI-like domain-containing protein [Muriicola sp. Z0-33]|uniref:GyrI-like domain-containing protein n=1 Tax=Muriicola sp. Z0-33 TaxID=2816957 RepID=UPI0022370717|nr:GyrI-like domain-containing protein [Muriicola sp. Z0-33]MCW5514759.1 GyrI-like domain-containing protein [Muriicola sp. Z0-33]